MAANVGARIGEDQSLATIWLLSSLGHGHSVPVKKREIAKVSIEKTCDYLAETQSNLPLRQTGQLLYGVAVCYERKTGFVLADVNTLRDSLQRQWIGLNPLRKSMKKIEKQLSVNVEDNFLQDDPNFDLMLELRLNSNLDFLDEGWDGAQEKNSKDGAKEKVEIRKDDIWKEIEAPKNVQQGDAVASTLHLNDEEDDLADIDLELNFRLDEVLTDAESEAADTSAVNSELGLEFDRTEHHRNIELGMPILEETDMGDDIRDTLKRTFELDDMDNSAHLQTKRNRVTSRLQSVKVDSQIGYLTDTLRHNHERYVAIMEELNAQKTSKAKCEIKGWLDLISSDQPTHLRTIMKDIFQPFSATNFPVGRRGRHIHSTGSSSRSSSVSSLEQGRRMDVSQLSSGSDPQRTNMHESFPVHMDDFPEISYYGDENPQLMNLDIPPSSVGRTPIRSYTGSSDQVDTLRQFTNRRIPGLRTGSIREGTTSGSDSFSQTYNENQHHLQIQDHQTEKFYHYILNRSIEIGKRTVGHSTFSRKFLFEDLVPSKLSHEEDNEVKSVTKRIASNAFLSLLQLSTLGRIKLDMYDVDNEDHFRSLNGDDIVIYC